MLKGYFYRRTFENDPIHSELNIRFEINSKEFIFAKPTNFNREGMRFILPRGKVILVPDERIMIILNSPEHGDFRIQCEVCYFCNHTQGENSLVSYGVNFLELSDSIWEVIREFCGGQLPEVGLAPTDAATPNPILPASAPTTMSATPTPVLAVEPPATSMTAEAIPPDRTPPVSFIPFAPLPPLVPTPPSQVYSLPDTPVAPKTPVEPNPKYGAISLSATPFAETRPTENLTEAVKPADNQIDTEVAATIEPATKKTVIPNTKGEIPVVPKATSQRPAITKVTPDIHAVGTTPSSIQVLAASLATPPASPTQVKAQSLSQEMIDRLIEKLQVESADTPIEPEPVIPVKTDTQTKQTAVEPVNFQAVGEQTPVNSDEPETAELGHISLNATTPVRQLTSETITFDPFNPFKFQPNDDLKTSGSPPAPSFDENQNKLDITTAIPEESSLIDLIINPNLTGIQNTGAGNSSVAVKKTNSDSLAPPATGKPKKNVTPVISIEKKKPVIPEIPVATPIIASPSGVSLDQKSIDKLVDSLLKEEMLKEQQKTAAPPPVSRKATGTTPAGAAVTNTAPTAEPQLDVILQALSSAKSGAHNNTPGTTTNPSPLKSLTTVEPKRTLDQKAIDQVVQALTQNYSAKKLSSPVGPRATGPFLNSQGAANLNNPTEAPDKTNTLSLTLLTATLQLEHGEILPCVIEQIYVGGLMVLVGKELSLNSPLKLNISGAGIRIIDVLGTCTNCEAAAPDGSQFLAEIFFKNMSNTHMEQFRTLIAKLEIKR